MATTAPIILREVRSDALARQEEWLAKRDGLLQVATGITAVADEAALNLAGGLLADAKKCIAALEKARKELTAPLDACKRGIMDQEKVLAAPLAAEIERLQPMSNQYATRKAAEVAEARRQAEQAAAEAQYRAQQEAAAAAEAQRLAEEAANARRAKAAAAFGEEAAARLVPVPVLAILEPEPVPVAAPLPQAPKVEGARLVTRWSHRITDPTAVPREYLTVDDGKIRAGRDFQVKMGREPAIPGVEFTKSISVEGR